MLKKIKQYRLSIPIVFLNIGTSLFPYLTGNRIYVQVQMIKSKDKKARIKKAKKNENLEMKMMVLCE